MTVRTTAMSAADVAARAAHARGFLHAAEIVDEFSDDVADAAAHVVGSLAVLAGIAAADAICGHALGRRSAGDNHDQAVVLVKTATTQGPEFARDLRRLLGAKGNVQYSPRVVTAATSRELMKYARRLVDGMEAVLRG